MRCKKHQPGKCNERETALEITRCYQNSSECKPTPIAITPQVLSSTV